MSVKQSKSDNSFVIADFAEGITDTPLDGFFDMRNCDIYTKPGIIRSAFSLRQINKYSFQSSSDQTVSVDATAADDYLTINDGSTGNFDAGDGVFFNGVAFEPTTNFGGLSTGTIYYAYRVSNTQIQVTTSIANWLAGTAVSLSDASGAITIKVPATGRGYFAQAKDGKIFYLDSSGQLWYGYGGTNIAPTQWLLVTGNSISVGEGLVAWKDYLFCFGDTTIDVLSLSSFPTTVTWSNSWQSGLASTSTHRALVGQDGIIYFINGLDSTTKNKYWIGSIQENTAPFAPGTSASYTYQSQALDLPDQPTSLVELGSDLLIGTNTDKIYPWDRTSDSFDLPIILPEADTQEMITINNITYCFTGYSGCIYATNGTTSNFVNRVPDHITEYYYSSSTNPVTFDGVAAISRRIYFGLNITSSSGFICSYDPTYNRITIENTVYTVPQATTISDILELNDKDYLVVSSGRILSQAYLNTHQVFDISDFNNNYEAYFVSPLFKIGSFRDKGFISEVEVSLGRPLTSGSGIVISYREKYEDAYTTLATIDYTTYGAIQEISVDAGIDDVDDIQFKVSLYAGATEANNFNSPEIKYVKAYYG